jgi:hypothetical protein
MSQETANTSHKGPTLPMSIEEIERLSYTDPAKAQQMLDVRARLREEKKRTADVESQVKFSQLVLSKTAEEEERWRLYRIACERAGHKREDGKTAVGGQRGVGGDFKTGTFCCQRCQKSYVGVGDGPGQLPSFIANSMDWELVGSA